MMFRTLWGLLPILVLLALAVFVLFKDERGVPAACKLPWATSICTKYIQEQQLKALEEMSRIVKRV
jgi:hypothetical protein